MKSCMCALAVAGTVFAVFGKTVYVSPEGCGSKDGTSPDNACLIKDVSGKIAAGDTISFADGTYSEWADRTSGNATFDFKKADIVMQGNADHPENVIFDYACDTYKNERGYVIRNPGAVRGITFRNYRQQGNSYPSMFLTVNLGGLFTIEHCRFENCSTAFGTDSQDCGCVLKMNHEASSSTKEQVVMDHCVISGCTNRLFGVVSKWKNGGSLTIRDCVFENCYSMDGGGSAIYFNDTIGKDLVDRCIFKGCSSACTGDYRPAAIRVNAGTAENGVDIRNCLFEGNSTVKDGDAACVFSDANGKCLVDNCTFVGNGSSSAANIFPLHGKTTVPMKATNCVFWNNADKNGQVNRYSANVTMDNCASTLSASPFTDAENGVYTLAKRISGEASPCVNTGATLDWMTEGAFDLAGNARVYGAAPDLGCYELTPSSGFLVIVQ